MKYTFKILGDTRVYLLSHLGRTRVWDTGMEGSEFSVAQALGAKVGGRDEAAWGRAVLVGRQQGWALRDPSMMPSEEIQSIQLWLGSKLVEAAKAGRVRRR